MANVLVKETSLTAIADAIRSKNGGNNTYKPAEMAPAILAIEGGGGGGGSAPVLTALEITENGTYTPGEGVDGFNSVKVNVPSVMTVLEYLDVTKAYINTGIYPSSETKIEIKVQRSAFADECLFGSRKSSSSSDRFVSFMSTTTNAHCQFYNSSYGITVPDYTGVDLVIELSKNGYYYNGELLQEVPQTAFTSSYAMYLFALNQANSIERPMNNLRCYYCKIWQNDTLVRDFVPVKLGSDLVCMYDKVENKFYLNRGSGSFTAGPVKE